MKPEPDQGKHLGSFGQKENFDGPGRTVDLRPQALVVTALPGGSPRPAAASPQPAQRYPYGQSERDQREGAGRSSARQPTSAWAANVCPGVTRSGPCPPPASTVASRWACSGRREGDGRGRHPGSFGTRDLGLLRTGRDATARSQNRATCSRKCLLLTHSATLFTIFEADVTASGLRLRASWSPASSGGSCAARSCRRGRSAADKLTCDRRLPGVG